MKQSILVTLCSLFFALNLFGQSGNINNTLGSLGIFTIKDDRTTFLTLSQSDGYLGLNGSLTLPPTTGSTLGVIYKGADRFIHDYKGAGTEGFNIFVGVNSGNFSLGGLNSYEGSHNTAVGHSSLNALTSGNYNSAFGDRALYSNTSGYDNSAFGNLALYFNTSGANNSAFGYTALQSNTSGQYNSAMGLRALYSSTSGFYNSAFGASALYNNTSGNYNSAFGTSALGSNTSGQFNSAFGRFAGSGITTGSNNTCIGYNVQVPDGAASNQVQIGDANVTYAGVQVTWSTPSDRRWKTEITDSDLGLSFVSMLRPVSYKRKNDEKQRTEYGFIAQELEAVLKEVGIENTGMLTIDSEGMYQVRYNDLLAPMVKAIQELKAENDALKKEMSEMKVKVEGDMQNRIREEIRKVLLKASSSQDESTKVSFNEN